MINGSLIIRFIFNKQRIKVKRSIRSGQIRVYTTV